MNVSNRFLLLVAGLSAVAVVVLTIKSPVTGSVMVLRARQTIPRDAAVTLGENAEAAAVSVARFGSDGHMIPATVVPLLGRIRLARAVGVGEIRTDDIASVVSRSPAEGAGETSYVKLSDLIEPEACAVSVNVSELGSFAHSLEPDDRIRIITPGSGSSTEAQVLAVGARTARGWTTASRRSEDFSTVTLRFATVTEGESFAKALASAPSAQLTMVLLSSHR